ncbi:alpha/beta fold hydrolase [Nocardioides caldifontis]|uniref:alpha/beta fold hydrolase n=1 Tax=Nocardioides caldifontis TaxID=2588938 RepID=UPI0011E06340|nr:alpha/beta hydrolase [Nocardioides caldifontis]
MSRRRTAGLLAGSGLAVATGGYLVDRWLGQRRLAQALAGEPELGSLRGTVHEVKADDEVLLHAEVDERAPYGSAGDAGRERVTVVLVHGFSLNLDCWHFQRQALRGRRRIVLYDQRSHGRSERSSTENATIDQLGHDLEQVLATLTEPDEKVVLVGHSMGGMTIVALAEQHPELFGDKVVGVGLVSTTAGGQRTHKIVAKHVPDALGKRALERGLLVANERARLLELVRENRSALGLWLVRQFAFGSGRVPAAHVAFVDEMIHRTPLEVLVEFIPQFDALDKFHVVEAFTRVPTLIVCGTEDKLTSIGHSRKLHSRIPGSELLELPGVGHMSIMEAADEVQERLDALLDEADLRAVEAEGRP